MDLLHQENYILETLESIVKARSMIFLHDNGTYPFFDEEDSCLYLNDKGQLVWRSYIGTEDEEVINVREECTMHTLKHLLDLLLESKVISQKTYDCLYGIEDFND